MDIIQYDQWLFSMLNGQWHNAFFDAIMPYWRSKYVWMPLYIFIASFLLINWHKRGLVVILFAVATISVADMASSKLMKPIVQRVRPCNDVGLRFEVRELVRCGGGYSFTSSHATNHFALAVFLSLVFGVFRKKWIRWALLTWAASIAYGQVYVGVHYPMDVITGAVLGSLIGLVFANVYERWTANGEGQTAND